MLDKLISRYVFLKVYYFKNRCTVENLIHIVPKVTGKENCTLIENLQSLKHETEIDPDDSIQLISYEQFAMNPELAINLFANIC